MTISPGAVLAVGAALDLIRFVIQRNDLQSMTPEEIMQEWAKTRSDVQAALDAWKAAGRP